jgi:hypothetical protein
MAKFKTPSNSSPKGGSRRGCLCEDGKYSQKCCDGSLQAQGIGRTTGTENVVVTVNNGTKTIVRQNG